MNIDNLNPMQKEAVMTTQGPLLIIAGAGSGKTKVLTTRVAYLIENNNVNPQSILAITFTNKAAREMLQRVEDLLGRPCSNMWISTFHSFCSRILRYHISEIGYKSDFSIYDTQDKKQVIKECIEELGYDPKRIKEKSVAIEISNAKDQFLDPNQYERQYSGDYVGEKYAQIYSLYQEKLKNNNALDFDDLIYLAVKLFKEKPEILKMYQEKFQYVMVDEYQDTNYIQYVLVKMLSEKYKNICVVGDDDQSIYSFRGADIRNILEFEKDYSDAKIIKLEQNYRSTKNILNSANSVIANNSERKNKKLWSDIDTGSKVVVYKAQNEQDEGEFIVKKIKEHTEEELQYKDIAILYRNNAMSRGLEKHLREYSIPYKIFGGLRFYDRAEIKDIMAYLKILENPMDDIAVKRVINTPKRGIGAKTVEKIQTYANVHNMTMLQAMQEDNKELSAATQKKVRSFYNLIASLKTYSQEFPLDQLFNQLLYQTGYKQMLEEEKTPEAQSRLENIKELLSDIKEFQESEPEPTLSNYLQNVSLITDMDKSDTITNYVTLMTIHSSKGLEFPIIFITAAEENIFPSIQSANSARGIEEERRLCYVAMTRAKKHLYITSSRIRMLYGRTQANPQSRFIDEIDTQYVKEIQSSYTSTYQKQENANKSLKDIYLQKYQIRKEEREKTASQGIKEYLPGTKVKHPTFGEGLVVGRVKDNYSIMFPKKGLVTINPKYVQLEEIK